MAAGVAADGGKVMQINDDESVKVVAQGEIAELLLNRPKHLNALSPDLLASLIAQLEKVLKEKSLRCIVISGAGEKAFAAGADISSMAQLGPRAIADYVELGQRAMRAIETAAVPVIAAVNGYALGGGLELALACDLIFASSRAQLGQPEVNLGIIPGFGATQRLAQRCGVGAARWLIYSGERISAEEALRLGVVDKVFPAENFITQVRASAELIASKGPLAVQQAKKVILQSQEEQLLSGLRREVEGFLATFATVDREEAMQAFLQKRPAVFRGK